MLTTICIAICFGSCIVNVCSPAPLIGIIDLVQWNQESSLETVLIFYGCCNKLPQTKCLKITHIYLTVSVDEKSKWARLGPLHGVCKLEIKAVVLTEGSREESASKLVQIIVQIQFLVFIWLVAPYSLLAVLIPSPIQGSLPATGSWVLPMPRTSDFSSATSLCLSLLLCEKTQCLRVQMITLSPPGPSGQSPYLNVWNLIYICKICSAIVT